MPRRWSRGRRHDRGRVVEARRVEFLSVRVAHAVEGVEESAVIGLPHKDFGEAVFAVIVAKKGASVTPEAALAAIAGDLARFKQPKAAVVVPDLPRNTMGKVQKNLLRQSYADWFK